MLITNFKVFITKNGDGAITFSKNNIFYKVFISKEDEIVTEIFNKYYQQLKSFKNRHYAIAKWIVRDIRAEGYVFRSYSNNNLNIRPVKQFTQLQNNLYELYSKENLKRKQIQNKFSDFERLIH
jgi:hypothetical protein